MIDRQDNRTVRVLDFCFLNTDPQNSVGQNKPQKIGTKYGMVKSTE